jgi:hypothetical protein
MTLIGNAMFILKHLPLKHMDELNVENAGAIFYFAQISHKIRAQLIFLGLSTLLLPLISEVQY